MSKSDSGVSRRNALLVGGGAVAAVGALAAGPMRSQVAEGVKALTGDRTGAPTVNLATGSYEDWLAQVGKTFALGGGSGMRLAGVRALASSGPRPNGLRARAFVALFDPLSGGTMAGDLIYTASNRETGALQLFLSTSTDPRSPARMLAVFN